MGAGLGLVGTALAGAAVGAGEVGKEGLEFAARSTLNDQLAEIQRMRDDRLEEFAKGREQRGYDQAREMQGAGFAHAEGMQAGQFAFTKAENQLMRDFQKSEHELNRTLQKDMHNDTIKVQMGQLGVAQAQLKLAQEAVTLQPLADGSYMKVGRDGKSQGQLSDLSGNVIYGTKDLTAGAQKMIDVYNTAIKGVEAELRTETDPEMKKVLRDRIDFYVAASAKLSGMNTPAAPGAAGKSGWDNESGTVMLNGQAIGNAKNEQQARKMIDDAKKGATAAPATTPKTADAKPGGIVQSAMPEETGVGKEVDMARTAVSAAQERLRQFGAVQRKRDPDGYATAQRAAAEAEAELKSALERYSGTTSNEPARSMQRRP